MQKSTFPTKAIQFPWGASKKQNIAVEKKKSEK
jgi:hypothetical protein